jgi:transcription antitermination factor NusG
MGRASVGRPNNDEATMSEPARKWYVLRVPAQCEVRVGHELRIRGHQTLVPTEEKRVNGNQAGKCNRLRKFPILARYVFIEGMPSRRHMDEIQHQPIKPLSFGSELATLQPGDVEYLRNLRSDSIPAGFNLHRAIKAGELARIASGPFAGHTATVRNIKGDLADLGSIGAISKVRLRVGQLEAA